MQHSTYLTDMFSKLKATKDSTFIFISSVESASVVIVLRSTVPANAAVAEEIVSSIGDGIKSLSDNISYTCNTVIGINQVTIP